MTDRTEPVIRVARSHRATPERHAYQQTLTDLWAVAMCSYPSLVTELRTDDPAVPMCPLCDLFLLAAEVDITQLDTNGQEDDNNSATE